MVEVDFLDVCKIPNETVRKVRSGVLKCPHTLSLRRGEVFILFLFLLLTTRERGLFHDTTPIRPDSSTCTEREEKQFLPSV